MHVWLGQIIVLLQESTEPTVEAVDIKGKEINIQSYLTHRTF